MKRIAVLLICITICAIGVLSHPVYAQPAAYARAANRNAYFFTAKNTATSIFAVPYTYCVEVLRDDGDWYYARYANDTGVYKSLYGYCRKDDFTLETQTPAVTFLYKTVTVNYTAATDSSSLPVLGEIALEAAYYGTYYSGATVYSYVYCQGSFGYIVGANDDYPLNLPPEEPPADEPSDGGEEPTKPTVSVGLIAFIVIAVLFAAVILIIWFTTKKPRVDG